MRTITVLDLRLGLVKLTPEEIARLEPAYPIVAQGLKEAAAREAAAAAKGKTQT